MLRIASAWSLHFCARLAVSPAWDRFGAFMTPRVWCGVEQSLWSISVGAHGREKDEKERRRLERLQPRVLLALYSKVDLLLACDKPIFDLPTIQERVKLFSRELEPGYGLSLPLANERALADAAQYLCDNNHTITAFLTSVRPDY